MTRQRGKRPRIVGSVKEYDWHFRDGTTLFINGVAITRHGGLHVVVHEPVGKTIAEPATMCDNADDINSAGQARV